MALRTYYVLNLLRSWGCGRNEVLSWPQKSLQSSRLFTIPVILVRLVSLIGRRYLSCRGRIRIKTLISGGLLHYNHICNSCQKGKQMASDFGELYKERCCGQTSSLPRNQYLKGSFPSKDGGQLADLTHILS